MVRSCYHEVGDGDFSPIVDGAQRTTAWQFCEAARATHPAVFIGKIATDSSDPALNRQKDSAIPRPDVDASIDDTTAAIEARDDKG